MKMVLRELANLRDDMHYQEKDPRVEFVNAAISLVTKTVSNTSYMTEDEMLENIGDPLVAIEIDPERLSSRNLKRLFSIAARGPDGDAKKNAIARLEELYARSVDHRESVLTTLHIIAESQHNSLRTRRLAAAACYRLGDRSVRKVSFLSWLLEQVQSLLHIRLGPAVPNRE